MEKLLGFVSAKSWNIRLRAAQGLKKFDYPQAKEALNYLRKDENYRVVATALESLL